MKKNSHLLFTPVTNENNDTSGRPKNESFRNAFLTESQSFSMTIFCSPSGSLIKQWIIHQKSKQTNKTYV